jgi:GTP cyclohydrolase IA
MLDAFKMYLEQTVDEGSLGVGHIQETPERFVRVLEESVRGCRVNPADFLTKQFSVGHYDEMIHVRNVRVMSLCAHHWERIIGRANFAYVPGEYIVGLSKIPRMIDVLCRRPQVQENLTAQIADVFQETVKPKGCAVSIRAYHMCMLARGVEEPGAYMETTALRGCFKDSYSTRQEFLSSIDRNGNIFP